MLCRRGLVGESRPRGAPVFAALRKAAKSYSARQGEHGISECPMASMDFDGGVEMKKNPSRGGLHVSVTALPQVLTPLFLPVLSRA